MWILSFPNMFCWRVSICIPHGIILALFLKIIWSYMWGFISELSILFHWSWCQYHTFYCGVVVSFFELRIWGPQVCSSFAVLFWLFGVPWVSIWFLGWVFLFLQKTAIGVLVEIALNLQIALGSVVMLTILSDPVHEHSMPFHSFISLFIFFSSVTQLSVYKSFTSWFNLFLSILFFLMLL